MSSFSLKIDKKSQKLEIPKFISSRGLGVLPPSEQTFFINTTHFPEDATRFSTDISRYVHEGWTVTHAALQIIFFMGFTHSCTGNVRRGGKKERKNGKTGEKGENNDYESST